MKNLSIRAQAALYGISKSTMGADRRAGCPVTEKEGMEWRLMWRRSYYSPTVRKTKSNAPSAEDKAECDWWLKELHLK